MAVSVSFTGRIQNVLEQLSLTKTWGTVHRHWQLMVTLNSLNVMLNSVVISSPYTFLTAWTVPLCYYSSSSDRKPGRELLLFLCKSLNQLTLGNSDCN